MEFFYELMMYSILIGLPLYELYRIGDDGEKKTEQLYTKLDNLDEDVISIHRSIEHQTKNVDKKITEMKETLENSQKTLNNNNSEMLESFRKNRKLFTSSFNENVELMTQMKQERLNFAESIGMIESKNFEIIEFLRNISQNAKPALE